MTRLFILIFTVSFYATGCRESPGLPKPRAFPRVEYPERKYIEYSFPDCPFTFQYPAYAEITEKKEACWFDLFMPSFQARIHCSYMPIKNRQEFDDFVQDAFVIASRINERANYMEESRIHNNQDISGLVLEWSGQAASPIHFFLSDTTHHFFKAALYFDSKVRPDSLAPITEFIKEDIMHLISTFDWKKE